MGGGGDTDMSLDINIGAYAFFRGRAVVCQNIQFCYVNQEWQTQFLKWVRKLSLSSEITQELATPEGLGKVIHLVKRSHTEAATVCEEAELEPIKLDRKEKDSDSKILCNKILYWKHQRMSRQRI